MIEIALILSCAYNVGCAETTSTYLQQQPQVRHSINTLERKVINAVPHSVLLTSSLFFVKRFRIPVTRNVIIDTDTTNFNLKYTTGF